MMVLADTGAKVVSTGRDALTVTGLGAERIAELVRDHVLRLYELTPRRSTLKDVYFELTRDVVDHTAGGQKRS